MHQLIKYNSGQRNMDSPSDTISEYGLFFAPKETFLTWIQRPFRGCSQGICEPLKLYT